MRPFLEALTDDVLLCDGAMGTMLYAQGVFINRSFDSLNLSDPQRVSSVHRAYVQAGATVVETNTFGANRLKLRAFGLGDRLVDINVAGVRLAREAAHGKVYVAGAIGPLGIRIEPWGRMTRDEAHAYFREQAQALAEGGVDLFILETFRDLNEIQTAIAAVRSVAALPVVAQMTIEEDGNTLDGTPPEQFAPSLQDSAADVIGLNCSIGPAHMLEALERMMTVASVPLAAQPNAGRPRDIEGRTIYLTSPEYVASYAKRFVDRRVRLVGGCCGTTPEHIAQIKAALQRTGPAPGSSAPRRSGDAAAPPTVGAPVLLSAKSALSRAFADRRWVRLVELAPPRGHDMTPAIDQAVQLRDRGVDAVHIPDNWSGPRVSALALAVLIHQQTGIEAVLQFSSRDKPLLGIQSELLGAFAMGVRNVLATTGDVHPVGDYPDATAVLDVDSVGLVNAVARLNQGLDVGGQTIGLPTAFHVGVTINPGAEDLDGEIRRFTAKVEAGAEYVVTRPVFDTAEFDRLEPHLEAAGLPVVLSLRPFENVLDAEYLAHEVPGTYVPALLLERMRRTSGAEAEAREGVAIAAELGQKLGRRVQGVNIMPPHGRLDLGLAVLKTLT